MPYRCRDVEQVKVFLNPLFTITPHCPSQVLLVGLNEGSLVPYIVSQLRDSELAIAIASRLNLPGADDLYQQQFTQLLQQGDVQGAAKVAAGSPRGLLRTPQTIQMFQQVPAQPGQPQPVFQYFSVLLERGKLNHMESVELAKPVLEQGELVQTCSCSCVVKQPIKLLFFCLGCEA